MRKPVQNIGASVRARLLNLAKERNQPFELLLIRYTLERLLYRLSKSKHREKFVLKGAMLMRHWLDDPHRPTRDLDLLGFGDNDPELTLKIFREICAITADDAVDFDTGGLVVDRVRDESGYSGLRLKTYATVDGARVRVVIDIGYGDATEPGLNDIELPVLLDKPAPNLRAYPYETVIAEKFQAMVALGLANTRLKDFYDIWILAQTTASKTTGSPRPLPRRLRGERPKFQPNDPTVLHQPSPATRRNSSNGLRSSRRSPLIPALLPMLLGLLRPFFSRMPTRPEIFRPGDDQ